MRREMVAALLRCQATGTFSSTARCSMQLVKKRLWNVPNLDADSFSASFLPVPVDVDLRAFSYATFSIIYHATPRYATYTQQTTMRENHSPFVHSRCLVRPRTWNCVR